ncbi:ATP-dependent exoDNAse (exonuclease V) beta subunit (contains helicase and exonuclease domains) [Treponema bryantii]|uniref:DNA 3'-5' helicase n=1 Tax=Treponema bryantii TaxID=163 RepID=A0A1I3LM22_9SPIR|nr:UvrD-helicase domain-containing protein [Treponema bryantii]SFI85804.1 ATP-dependent exoDNAse (exonuclease V) beta subunit (contains helicase and exonuclease domains) [Treponema bryantii]
MKNIKYISASAGSGKTYSLTKVLTEAIQQGKVEPENVILTTYTRAAATEFKEKAKAMLYENGLVTEADRLDQALIGTIHAVAEALIQKYWYVLGLSPKINPIAEEDKAFFKEQSLINLLKEEELAFLNGFAEEFSIKITRSSKIDYQFWKNDLSQILEFATNYSIIDFQPSIEYSKNLTKGLVHGGHHIKVNKDALSDLLDKAEQLNEANESEEQESLRYAIKAQRRYLEQKESNSFTYAKSVLAFLDRLPWEEIQSNKDTVTEGLNNLYSTEEVREKLNHYIDLLFELAERWTVDYENYKKEHHLIDFSDMEKFFDMLLDNKEVAAEIKATYKYVFVDEFQDCSPIQVKIFDKLSEIVDHSIWVGDKKQAIYAFRGSATELTTSVMDIIKENETKGLDGCTTDILDHSWRSCPQIVNFTNEVYAYAFGKKTEEERKEVCLEPVRKDEGKVGFWWFTEPNIPAKSHAIAANIIDLINNGEKPSDIAVLARTNSDLEAVANALREYDVSVFIDEDGLSGAYTVSLVTSILQLIADDKPELPKAQIAFLTEPDYKLERLLDDKLSFNEVGDKEAAFYDDIPLVKKILEERNRYKLQSVSALVESLIVELDLYNVAKKLNDAADSTKILHAIIDAAGAYEEHCAIMHLPSSILGFIAYLDKNNISVPGSTDGVQFFTYYKSKGLEWKTVIVLGCDYDFLEEKLLIKRNYFGTQFIRTAPSTKENLFPEIKISVFPNLFSGNSRIAEEWLPLIRQTERYNFITRKEIEEMKRLMYVAMTRPRDKLILALNGKGKSPKPLVAFQEMGFKLSGDYSGKVCDLFNVGALAELLPNAKLDIEYVHEKEKNTILKLAGKPSNIAVKRDLTPSSMQGGEVKAEMLETGTPITVTGKADSATLGTCIHDIFCVADSKSDKDIADMVKAYGFESNLPKPDEIKKAWEALTSWLTSNYGPAQKQYHELPFKHQLKTGQIVTGSMDFVWETASGCEVVDYKTTNANKEALLNKATDIYVGKYKGQLECYEQALNAAEKKVIAKVLYYPVIGVIVKID